MANSKLTDPDLLSAKLITFFSSPVFVLIFSFVLGNLQTIRNNPQATVIFFVIGTFFPIILYIHYLYINRVNLFEYISIPQSQRNALFLTAIASFALDVAIFTYSGMPSFWVYSGMLFVILFAIYYLINKFIDKASFHAGIFAFSVLYLTNRISVVFAILLVLIPFIGWSRVYLHKHTWFQIMLGTVVGMFIALLSWTF